MKIITDHILKGRWEETRPPHDKELKATTVLELTIKQASAKIRTGPPIDDKEDYAYYSRGMNENDTDIHRVKMPVFVVPAPVIAVRGRLIDSKTKQPIEARIFYERLPDGVQIGITKSQAESGDFEIILPVGELYGFRAEAEGYLPINENIDLRNAEGEFVVIERDMFLAPVEKDVTVVT